MRFKMTMKTKTKYPPKFKKLCHDAVETYMEVMCLQQFVCGFRFSPDPKPAGDRDGYDTLAEIEVDRRYLTATITIYPCLLEDWQKGRKDNKQVGDVLAHECAHMLTEHLHQLATSTYKDSGEMADAREVLTQMVARLAIRIVQLRNHEK